MEILLDLEFKYLRKQDFNNYKKAHIIFYSQVGDNIKYLFLKNINSSDKFSHITTSVLPQDTVPTFSIARILVTELLGLFSDANIRKISTNELIMEKDLVKFNEFHYHDLWETPQYFEWLNKISDKPIVQYDMIEGHQFFFYELPYFANMDSFNDNLKALQFKYFFRYFDATFPDYDQQEVQINDIINPTTLMFFKSFNSVEYIKSTMQNIKEDKLDKFYILSIKPAEGSKQDQAGFFHFPALFQGIYRKNHENWVYIVCSIDKLPIEEELENAKAIIIPGSHLSIYNDHDFLRKTEEWIKHFHINHEKVKFLGICFGMQIFISALGGKVEKMGVPFVRGPTKINLNDEFWDLDFIKNSGVNKNNELHIMQAHGDECTFIPEELKIKNFGKSDSCYHEVLVCQDERILLIQGHPEYHPCFNIERMAPFYLARLGKEKNLENLLNIKNEMYEDMLKYETNSLEFRMICNSFLKN